MRAVKRQLAALNARPSKVIDLAQSKAAQTLEASLSNQIKWNTSLPPFKTYPTKRTYICLSIIQTICDVRRRHVNADQTFSSPVYKAQDRSRTGLWTHPHALNRIPRHPIQNFAAPKVPWSPCQYATAQETRSPRAQEEES